MKRISVVIIVLLLLTLLGCNAEKYDSENNSGSIEEGITESYNTSGGYIECLYYNAAQVSSQISSTKKNSEYTEIAGAIVPHYAPAMGMLCDILSSVETAPDTVVVIAPNHEARGALIQVSGSGFYWNSGSIRGNTSLAEKINKDQRIGAVCDDTVISKDWSASVLMPYIGNYFPDAQVTTVLISRGASYEQLHALALCIFEESKTDEILILCSADFSHYQDEATARVCDEKTFEIIENAEIPQLLNLGNEYTDSPETIAVLLDYMKLRDKKISKTDGLFETFISNGQRTAGSYYSYVVN